MQVVEKLGFDVIVLAKQPNQSLTVIEKLERDIERVGFAFIIYTPDDIGGLQGSDQRPRARQNVIFEHGLLSGKMGRDRTCAIVVGSDIEFPSDIFGMLYEEFDSFDGKDLNHIKRIVDILKAAGYEVDLSPFLQ
ncbi:MAG: nucleotide-binding protein [Desulfobacteraceae bacterium]